MAAIQHIFFHTNDNSTSFVVMDNDSRKWGQRCGHYPILSPAKIAAIGPDIVVIVSTYAHDILQQLIKYKTEDKLDFKIATY